MNVLLLGSGPVNKHALLPRMLLRCYFGEELEVISIMKKYIPLVLMSLLSSGVKADNLWMDCGIGHWIAGPTLNGFPAMSTNLTFDLGTTATISDLSTPSTCAGPFWAAARFIEKSYPRLEEETALGGGEYMVAMLEHFECDKATNEQIRSNIRTEFSNIVSDTDYHLIDRNSKARAYYKMVSNEVRQYPLSCGAI